MNTTRPFWVQTVGGVDYKLRPTPFSGSGMTADEETLKAVTDVDVAGYRAADIRLQIVGIRRSGQAGTALTLTGKRRAG